MEIVPKWGYFDMKSISRDRQRNWCVRVNSRTEFVLTRHRGLAAKILAEETKKYMSKLDFYKEMQRLTKMFKCDHDVVIMVMELALLMAAANRDGIVLVDGLKKTAIKALSGGPGMFVVTDGSLEAAKTLLTKLGLMTRDQSRWMKRGNAHIEVWDIDLSKAVEWYISDRIDFGHLKKEFKNDLAELNESVDESDANDDGDETGGSNGKGDRN